MHLASSPFSRALSTVLSMALQSNGYDLTRGSAAYDCQYIALQGQ